MMILEIEGQRVEVDDAFAQMTPEQQAQAVDEIAKQMAIQPASSAHTQQVSPVQQAQGKQDSLSAVPDTQASTLEDVARSAGSGLRQGIETTLGLPGDAADFQGKIAEFISSQLGADEDTAGRIRDIASKFTPFPMSPTSDEIQKATGQVLGAPHEPQTTAGEFSRTIGEFAPAIAAGPGGVARKAAVTLGSGLASEGAGQLTEGTDVEPLARVGGALLGGGVTAGIRGGGVRQATKNAPTADKLKETTDKLFNQLRQSGVTYDANAYGKMVSGLQTDLVKKGFRNANAPQAHKLVEELMQEAALGRAPDFSDVQALRSAAGNMVRTADSSERAAASLVRDAIDDFERLSPLSNTGNMTRGQFNRLRGRAREMSLRTVKQRALDDIVENAETLQGGFESGLRTGVGGLLRSKKGKQLFKGAERKALLEVSQGTITRNTVRNLGKFGFDVGKMGGNASFLPTIGGLGAGALVDPLVGGGLVAAGTAAKAISPKLTQRAFNQAGNLIRSGKANKLSSSNKIAKQDSDIAIRRLISGGNPTLLPPLGGQ